jgi:hypothetical protein
LGLRRAQQDLEAIGIQRGDVAVADDQRMASAQDVGQPLALSAWPASNRPGPMVIV